MIKKFSFVIVGFVFIFFANPAHAANITGKITYDGKRPKLRPIKMEADPICLTHQDNTVYPAPITLGENFEMGYVVVHISKGLPNKEYTPPTEPLVLDQKGCMYDPPVFGVMAGQPVKILNPDGTLHNVHSLAKKNPQFNIAMPKFRKEVTKQFDVPELMFPIKCDVHPWMVTHGNVFSHPFFDVTNEEGTYQIDNLPPGEYVIEAIQQRLEPKQVTVTLKEGETKTVDFKFSRPDGK